MNEVKILDKTFDSINQAAKYYNLDYHTMKRNLAKFGHNDPRVTMTKSAAKYSCPIVLCGTEYDSLFDAALDHHMPLELLVLHIKRYGTQDLRIFNYQKPRKHTYEYQGHAYTTLKDLATACKLPYELVKNRSRYNNTVEYLTKQSRDKRCHEVEYQGRKFSSLKAVAEYYHVPVQTFYKKYRKYGNIEQVVTNKRKRVN